MIETAILFTLLGFVGGVASLFYYSRYLEKKYLRTSPKQNNTDAAKIDLGDGQILCYWKSTITPGTIAVQISKDDPDSFFVADTAYFKDGNVVETYSPKLFIRKILNETK